MWPAFFSQISPVIFSDPVTQWQSQKVTAQSVSSVMTQNWILLFIIQIFLYITTIEILSLYILQLQLISCARPFWQHPNNLVFTVSNMSYYQYEYIINMNTFLLGKKYIGNIYISYCLCLSKLCYMKQQNVVKPVKIRLAEVRIYFSWSIYYILILYFKLSDWDK